MDNIILIGMPASGKSTVGVVLAKRLGYEFIDTDLLIQKQEQALLREIIAEKGEDGFLVIEDQVNADLEAERSVIAPGGSVVYCENAMKHYKEIGTVVYLQTSYQTIKKESEIQRSEGLCCGKDRRLRISMKSAECCLKSMQMLQFAKMD